MTYKDKFVCFVDILGFGKMVENHVDTPERIYNILSRIKTEIIDWVNAPITSNIDLKITQFSDSIVLSFCPVKHYLMTFDFLKKLSVMMAEEGMVFRGGITYGKIHHDQEFVFGPAMNRAYYLEHDVAILPRIVIDEIALSVKSEDGKMISDYPEQFVFTINTEELSHVDYTYHVLGYARNQNEYHGQLREMIARGLGNSDDRVKQKYEWMKKEYNLAKEKFPDLILL